MSVPSLKSEWIVTTMFLEHLIFSHYRAKLFRYFQFNIRERNNIEFDKNLRENVHMNDIDEVDKIN